VNGIGADNGLVLVLMIAFFLCSLWMLGRILRRAGFHPAWGLIMWLPVINLVAVWAFAFLKWPNQRKSDDPTP